LSESEIIIAFRAQKAFAELPNVTVLNFLEGLTGLQGSLNLATERVRELLAEAASVALTAEVQILDDGDIETVAQSEAAITRDIITGSTIAPQPSFGTLPILAGGTGATTAAGARTNLGIALFEKLVAGRQLLNSFLGTGSATPTLTATGVAIPNSAALVIADAVRTIFEIPIPTMRRSVEVTLYLNTGSVTGTAGDIAWRVFGTERTWSDGSPTASVAANVGSTAVQAKGVTYDGANNMYIVSQTVDFSTSTGNLLSLIVDLVRDNAADTSTETIRLSAVEINAI
jgi:hypothetical protein